MGTFAATQPADCMDRQGCGEEPFLRPVLGEQGGEGSYAGAGQSGAGGTGEHAGGPDPVGGQRATDHAAVLHPHAAAADAAVDWADARRGLSGGERKSDRSGDELPLEREPGARAAEHEEAEPTLAESGG